MKFGTIIADPPWPYNQPSKNWKNKTAFATDEYELMTVADIAALPVGDVAADNSALLLWTTMPFLPFAFEIMGEWGFTYKTAIPWIKATEIVPGTEPAFKPKYGVGYWFRGAAEMIVVGSKGSPRNGPSSTIGLLSDSAKHSRKPDTIFEYAEGELPEPRLEMFARRVRPGWVSLGNEIDGRDIRETLPELRDIVEIGNSLSVG